MTEVRVWRVAVGCLLIGLAGGGCGGDADAGAFLPVATPNAVLAEATPRPTATAIPAER